MNTCGTIKGLIRAEGPYFGKPIEVHVGETHQPTSVLIDGQPADVVAVEAQFTYAGIHSLGVTARGETARLLAPAGLNEKGEAQVACHLHEAHLNLSGFVVDVVPGPEGPSQQVVYQGKPVRGLELIDLECKASDAEDGGEGVPLTRFTAQFLARRL